MNGIEKLYPQNHDLYRRVQHLVSLRWKWEAIADDVGLVGPSRVKELCDWVLAYREPKAKPMVNSQVLNVPEKSKALLDKGVRLAVWRRETEGARKALEAAEL
jgi:hypothetical protein